MIREKLLTASHRVRNSPVLRQSVARMKPKKTVWGFLGIVVFFFVPEIVAFGWGADITAYARTQMLLAPSASLATWYEGLILLFQEGGSWVNLAIGSAFLVWFFF